MFRASQYGASIFARLIRVVGEGASGELTSAVTANIPFLRVSSNLDMYSSVMPLNPLTAKRTYPLDADQQAPDIRAPG